MAGKGKGKRVAIPNTGRRGGFAGGYGSESYNLSQKTLRKAGAARVARKRTVSISDTRREGSRTLGPGGKPLNGTVIMQNGSKAVYKDGRRVQAADAAKPKSGGRSASSRPTGGSGSGSSGSGSGGGGRSASPPKVGEVRRGRAGRYDNRWDGKKWVRVPTQNRAQVGRTAAGANALAKDRASRSSMTPEQARALQEWIMSSGGKVTRGKPGTGKGGIPASALGVGDKSALTEQMRAATSRENWGKAYATGAAVAAGAGLAYRGATAARIVGGTSKSGKSTTNRVAIGILKAQKRLEAARKAREKARRAEAASRASRATRGN